MPHDKVFSKEGQSYGQGHMFKIGTTGKVM